MNGSTWWGPCRTSIPRLTELQKKNSNVAFIGVSAFERDQSKVKPFVEEMGDKMAYRVAVDDVGDKQKGSEGAMAKTWMTAAGQNGIPTAFIINKEGKIAWIGHPMSMDEPLEKITAWIAQICTCLCSRHSSGTRNLEFPAPAVRNRLVDGPRIAVIELSKAAAVRSREIPA